MSLGGVYEYHALHNFMKAYKRHMCAQKISFNTAVLMNELDNYFIFNGQPSRAYYRNLPLNENGKKDGTNCKMIISALGDLGYQNYYKDYWYICHYYFGWVSKPLGCQPGQPKVAGAVPTIKDLMEKVEINVSLILDQWNKLTKEEKKGLLSLPTQYLLCQELRRVDYKCDIDDFKLPKTRILDKYDSVYKLMSTRAGFNFIPISANP